MNIGYYYINLERSPERNKYIKNLFDKNNIVVTRVVAIDGDSKEDLNKEFNFINNYKRKYRNQLGCVGSHLKTIKLFLESSFDYALILEDDVSFDIIDKNELDLDKTLKHLIKILPQFGILQLSYIWGSEKPFLKNKEKIYAKWRKYYSACSYLISKQGAKDIITKLYTDSKLDIDLVKYNMSRYVADSLLYCSTNTLTLKFCLFVQNKLLDTTICSNKKTHQKASIIIWKVLDKYKFYILQMKQLTN
jgi:GR25 family glycosyltransferase involved in LPS biosynthesis